MTRYSKIPTVLLSSKRAFADTDADIDKRSGLDVDIKREASKMKAAGSFDSKMCQIMTTRLARPCPSVAATMMILRTASIYSPLSRSGFWRQGVGESLRVVLPATGPEDPTTF